VRLDSISLVGSQTQGRTGSIPGGFQARLNGASLWDLVQMECQARTRRVVRLSSRDAVGYLYFSDGEIVHAQTQRAFGERAAVEILQWSDGSFDVCERAWPASPTIHTSHEALLLHVAKLRDEQAGSNLVTFPGRQETAGPEPTVDLETLEIEDEGGLDMTMTADVTHDFPVALRLSSSGAVLKNKGASEEEADAVAYAARLVELTGELLGAGRFVAMECAFKDGRFLLYTESNGDTVALRPRADANLTALRDKLGL
jgi:Domain of unknown function (DUF4388)